MTSTVQANEIGRTEPLETVPQSVDRATAVAAIVAEVGTFRVGRRRVTCDPTLAGRTLDWIDGFVIASRGDEYRTQYPTEIHFLN